MNKTIKLNETDLRRMVENVLTEWIGEAVDGGWEVDENEAQEAYRFACEQLGKESVDEQIIQSMSSSELAACLAFIFRMNDFQEWENYKQSKEY